MVSVQRLVSGTVATPQRDVCTCESPLQFESLLARHDIAEQI